MTGTLESTQEFSHPLVSWRSVLAGLLISLLAYVIMIALGIGIGGVTLAGTEDVSAASAGLFSGLWVAVSAAFALFGGSYFASRVSRFSTQRIGSAQALVIASLFFGFLIVQLASSLGTAGKALGVVLGSAGRGITTSVSDLAANPQVQDIVQDAIADLDLRSNPEAVVKGVASRLVRGDQLGARNYLAHQAHMSAQEAQSRIDHLKNEVQNAMGQAAQMAARTLSAAGLSLFVMLAVGALAAMTGGALGARLNSHKPLARESVGLSGAGYVSVRP